MQGAREPATKLPAPPSEDDMTEGDLGDGMSSRPIPHPDGCHQTRTGKKRDLPDVLPQTRLSKRCSEGSSEPFSWTSCSAAYTASKQELETGAGNRDAESDAGDSSEVLQRRLHEVMEEVELLRTELEVTHRHLEGKHEALRILQGQAILDKATSHTKILLQKSEERTKALEKEVNALQWEITFNQVQFKNIEHAWTLKCERMCAESKALGQALEKRLQQLHELQMENTSLSQQCLELLGLLSPQERRDFQKTQPPCSKGREGSSLELAVYGACQCVPGAGNPCPCAKSAAASRRQVHQLQQELEEQTRRKEEAYVMVDAFRVAFEQQLRRGSEEVLRMAARDGRLPRQRLPQGGKLGAVSVAQRLRRFLPSAREGKVQSNPMETLHLLLDLLHDKEEALAHQRKVSYMLARSSEDREKRTREPSQREARVRQQPKEDGADACVCSEDGTAGCLALPASDGHGSVTTDIHLKEEKLFGRGEARYESSSSSATGSMRDQTLDYFLRKGAIHDRDAADINWYHAANSRDKINEAIKGPAQMIEADVLLRGRDPEEPIMAHPPHTDSDIMLKEWLRVVEDSHKGIKLDFKSLAAVAPSMVLLEEARAQLKGPVWINADVLPGPGGRATPLDAQTFLQAVAQVAQEDVLSLGWTTGWSQDTDNPGYNWEMVQQMETVCRPLERPVTFPVRAALLPQSFPQFQWLLQQSDRYTLTIWTGQDDVLNVEDLLPYRQHFHKSRIYYDLLDSQLSKFKTLPGYM
ncbi:coiled-coil domain-containing protein 125 [Electrophorus electricus]|uniref:coiled-coil domain-containing protein 125 n=1 Tax=Electrophorus electricus TaxID=8005 RepID=UPI0015CFF8A6|nr:coiled-coil domain-containing protein 125 [Electrophorus electricus]